MNQTLLKIFISAIILCLLAIGELSAQSNAPAKRNWLPNPKKKADPSSVSPNETAKTKDTLNGSKIVNTKADIPANETPVVQEGTVIENPPEQMTSTNTDFESRSIAKKTLEIAKRTSVVDAPPTEIYKVGFGDILFISLQNAPGKESTYYTVLKDGTIDYPLAGEMVQVAGLTTEQIEDLLKEKIKLYENPQVGVKVREHNSHIFTVLGLVEKSGEKQMQREALPLYVVQAEAVVQSKANQVTVKRNGVSPQTLALKDVKTGEFLIFPGDIVEFGSDESTAPKASQFYYISGEINSGGKKEFTVGITLTQAIIESGDLKKKSSRKVIIRRTNEEGKLVASEYDLKAINDGKISDPVLIAGDRIEIVN